MWLAPFHNVADNNGRNFLCTQCDPSGDVQGGSGNASRSPRKDIHALRKKRK